MFRGNNGPLHVSYGTVKNPLYNAFIEAGIQAGYPRSEDLNGYQQEGFGRLDMTVNPKSGTRWSTASAYLRPARSRENLTVITGINYILYRKIFCLRKLLFPNGY